MRECDVTSPPHVVKTTEEIKRNRMRHRETDRARVIHERVGTYIRVQHTRIIGTLGEKRRT